MAVFYEILVVLFFLFFVCFAFFVRHALILQKRKRSFEKALQTPVPHCKIVNNSIDYIS